MTRLGVTLVVRDEFEYRKRRKVSSKDQFRLYPYLRLDVDCTENNIDSALWDPYIFIIEVKLYDKIMQ